MYLLMHTLTPMAVWQNGKIQAWVSKYIILFYMNRITHLSYDYNVDLAELHCTNDK